MKTRIFLLCMTLITVCTFAQAQATKSIPLGKKGKIGLDTHIPIQGSMDSSVINRQLAAARASYEEQRKRVARQQENVPLTKEDLADEKDYVITPDGNIKKGAWQACEYFAHWEKRQRELQTPFEEFMTARERLLLQFDISDNYCQILAQLHAPEGYQAAFAQRPDLSTEKISLKDLTIDLPADIKLPQISPAAHTKPILAGEPLISPENQPEPARFSWTEVRYEKADALPNNMTPRKAKRYLKHFVRDNYADLETALAAQQGGERLNVGQRRLLTSYESLCSWYTGTHPKESCPSPKTLL